METLVCPNILLVVYRSTPAVKLIVAKVCRATCEVICLVIPAASAHWLRCVLILDGDGNFANTLSLSDASPRSGTHFKASSDKSTSICLFVFFIVNSKCGRWLSNTISPHVNACISLILKPQKHSNKKACFTCRCFSSGVSISLLTSSTSRKQRLLSSLTILSLGAILAKGFACIKSLLTAALRAAVNIASYTLAVDLLRCCFFSLETKPLLR